MERYYPELENRPDVPRDVAEAVRLTFDNFYQLRDGMENLPKRILEVVRRDPIDLAFLRQNLQSAGRAPMNVTGLLGLLANPQIAGAPSVEALPDNSDPQSQDGALVSLNNNLFRFDGETEPGTWRPIQAIGVIDFGLRSAKPAAGNSGVTFFETDTGWYYYDNGTNFLYLAGVNKTTEATRAALSVGTNDNGALLYATDTDVWWRVASGVWTRMWPFYHEADVTPVSIIPAAGVDGTLISFSVPAGAINAVDRTIRIFGAGGYVTQAGQTPTVNIKVKLGSLTLLTWTSVATTASSSRNWNFTADITTAISGASGTLECHGNMVLGLGFIVTSPLTSDTNTSTIGTIDLTSAQPLTITLAFSTQTGGAPFNSATQRQLTVGIVN